MGWLDRLLRSLIELVERLFAQLATQFAAEMPSPAPLEQALRKIFVVLLSYLLLDNLFSAASTSILLTSGFFQRTSSDYILEWIDEI